MKMKLKSESELKNPFYHEGTNSNINACQNASFSTNDIGGNQKNVPNQMC